MWTEQADASGSIQMQRCPGQLQVPSSPGEVALHLPPRTVVEGMPRETGRAGELAAEEEGFGEPTKLWVVSQLCCVMWESYSASLCLRFPICKPGGRDSLP